MDITGAQLIIRFLESAKDSTNMVAVIPGGSALASLERALGKSARKPAADAEVLFFDFAASVTQASAAIASARVRRQGLVCIAVQVRRGLMGTEACQPAARGALQAITKSWFHVGAAMELLELLPAAFRIANSGRRGPVLLEIPKDVLDEVMQGAWIPRAEPRAPAPRVARSAMLFT
jgi:acetolactate synthase-1/2/3 large subunit